MKVIVFAKSKGGVGGTTLLYNVAVYLADVLGRTINVSPTPDASTVGAALVAGASLSGDVDFAELATNSKDGLRAIEPDPVNTAEYKEHYGRWVEAQERLQGFL